MTESLTQLLSRMRTYSPWVVLVELAIIWLVVYLIVRFLRGTRGAGMIKGLALLLIVGTLAVQILGGDGGQSFQRLTYLYNRSLALLAIAFIVVFQPELRRALIRLGETTFFRRSRRDVAPVIDAVTEACAFLARNRIGALIAIERSVGLGGVTEGGTRLNADVSSRLLQSIFWPNSALHDLGVVIRDGKIVAAGVQFPMAEQGELAGDFGSRHRAAVGITHESDCIAIIVSEERGEIRVAEWGRMLTPVSPEQLREMLFKRLVEPTSKTERLRLARLEESEREKSAAAPEVPNAFDESEADEATAKDDSIAGSVPGAISEKETDKKSPPNKADGRSEADRKAEAG